MQKITPHLWFDTHAKEAAEFYVDTFGGDSKVTSATTIENTPSGNAEMVTFTLRGQDFMAISAGPVFTFNPSVSFILNFDPSQNARAQEELGEMWEKLMVGGKALMELNEYPFSKKYGWLEDKYGVSWQLILSRPEGEPRPFITPSLMFTKEAYGKAEEAMNYYVSVFQNSKIGTVARYPAGMEPEQEGKIMYEDFMLDGVWLAAMESAGQHDFQFGGAISFVVSCDTQEEIDFFWEKLSARPEAEQCGWCVDKFGVTWQVVPTVLGTYMSGTPEQRNRVTQAFLPMKKFDIATLEQAYRG